MRKQPQHHVQCFQWVMTLRVGVKDTDINQGKFFTSNDAEAVADACCELAFINYSNNYTCISIPI